MDKEIDRIQKNPETDIVIRIDEFNGRAGVTIREFVKSERYTGFTKAGTRIPADKFHLFKAAINSINEKELATSAANAPSNQNAGTSHSGHSTSSSNKPVQKVKQSEDLEEVEF